MPSLINNLQPRNHWHTIQREVAVADEIMIVSPFLDECLLKLVDRSPPTLTRLQLITRLPTEPGAATDMARRLLRLCDWAVNGSRSRLKVEIRHNAKLHGKVYLTKHGEGFKFAALGSANCTNNGLYRNHEWGVAFSDPTLIAELAGQIESTFPFAPLLDRAALEEIKQEADEILANNKETLRKARGLRLDLRRFAKTETTPPPRGADSLPQGVTVWLKPVGDTKEPIDENEDYWSDPHWLHFGKRPTAVKVGDLMVAYAVGHKKIVGLFEVTGDVQKMTPEKLATWPRGERWPWEIPSRPLTPVVSRNWPHDGMFLRELVKAFEMTEPTKPERDKVARLSGALQRKNDKIRLFPGFAAFVLSELYQRNAED